MQLSPYAQVSVGIDRDMFGLMQYCGDCITWNLPGILNEPDAAPSNLALDPTGQFAIQQPVFLPIDADETLWTLTPGGAETAIYAHGTDEQTGKTFLRQTVGTAGVTFDRTFKPAVPRPDDVGFRLDIFRGGAAAASGTVGDVAADGTNDHAFYVEFSAGRVWGSPGLRLAAEAGNPLRLDVTTDGGATWQSVATADALGESESYLTGAGRRLRVDVCPLTDASYYDDPQGAGLYSQPPPSRVVVSINGGDAVLVWAADKATLPAGCVRVQGLGGQWSCRYYKRRYAPTFGLALSRQARFRPLQTEPRGRLDAYAPYPGGGSLTDTLLLTPTLVDNVSATATLQGQTPGAGLDGRSATTEFPGGTAWQTVILSAAHAEFPAISQGPVTTAQTRTYDVPFLHETHGFDQSTFLRRSSATLTLLDTDGSFAPGQVHLGVRGAQITRGLTADGGYDDGQIGLTGLTGLKGPIQWERRGSKRYFTLTLSDRLRDGKICGFLLPFDGQCHYYALRQLAYRMGFTDDWLDFPYCERDSPCSHYHLPVGTLTEPLLRFPPTTPLLSAMLQIRALSAELDPASGAVLPMYLYQDSLGVLRYYGMPVGLVQSWLDPSLTPVSQSITLAQVYKLSPDDGQVNEFTGGGPMMSQASLENIRNVIAVVGRRPTDGAFVYGAAYNPSLGNGPDADPTVPGYGGLDMEYFHISKLYSSPEAAYIGAQNAAVQMNFPSISTRFTGHLQSGLFPLMPIGVQDPYTQGTADPVPYYVTATDSLIQTNEDGTRTERTIVDARLLGQAN